MQCLPHASWMRRGRLQLGPEAVMLSGDVRAMATLQIRDLPDPLSLSQQALSNLQQACVGDPRERRRQTLADLQAMARKQEGWVFDPSP